MSVYINNYILQFPSCMNLLTPGKSHCSSIWFMCYKALRNLPSLIGQNQGTWYISRLGKYSSRKTHAYHELFTCHGPIRSTLTMNDNWKQSGQHLVRKRQWKNEITKVFSSSKWKPSALILFFEMSCLVQLFQPNDSFSLGPLIHD